MVNSNTLEGKWEQLKGAAQKQWGKISNDQFDVIAGDSKILAGKIQEAYGVSEDEANKQIDDFHRKHYDAA